MNFYERFFAQHKTFVLKIAIFFIYLLIIYPACPARGKKSDDPTCTGHRFFFFIGSYCAASAFCLRGKCLPDVTGKIEGAQRAHRPGAAKFHGPGHTGFDATCGLRRAAIGPDVLR